MKLKKFHFLIENIFSRRMIIAKMKTKTFLKHVLSASLLVAISFLMVSSASAEIGAGYDSGTGALRIGVGSNGSGAGNVWGGGGSGGGWSLNNPYGLPSGSILGILSNLLFWLLSIFAILGVVGFVLSGIFYLLAGADENLAKKGKAGMTASIIGIIIGLSGFIVMQAAAAFLGGNTNKF